MGEFLYHLETQLSNVAMANLFPAVMQIQSHVGPRLDPTTEKNAQALRGELAKCKSGKFCDYHEIEVTAMVWLQKDRIPLGKITLFSGPPGIGKTSVSDDLIARLTSGRLSDIPAGVLVLAEEDSLSDTTIPRLMTMGANLRLIKGLTMTIVNEGKEQYEREFALGTDLDLVSEWLTAHPDVKLVVVDPFTNYLGEFNMNKEQDVRKVLMPVKRMAEEFNVAVVLIGHFNKNAEGDAITRQGGATALTGVPRVVWNFTKDAENEGECLMASPKNSHLKSQRYKIVPSNFNLPNGKNTEVGIVEWLGESTQSADSNLEQLNDPDRKKCKLADQWLKENISERQEAAADLIQRCKSDLFCSRQTVTNAATKLEKDGWLGKKNVGGTWMWWKR